MIKQKENLIKGELEQRLKECEGCYCQKPSDSSYDFCFDCLDCDTLSCGEYDPWTGNCCACYGTKNKKLERKKLSFTQRQRLNWEQVKRNAEDKIEEIKEEGEETNQTKDIGEPINTLSKIKKSKNKELSAYSDKIFLQELKKRIQKGRIDFEYDMYDREIGLRCANYQWNFPDVWDKKGFWKFKKEKADSL